MKEFFGKKGDLIVLLGAIWMSSIVLHNIFLNDFTNLLTIIVSFVFIYFLIKTIIIEELKEDKDIQDKIEKDKNE